MKTHYISPEWLTLEQIDIIIKENYKLALTEEAAAAIDAGRKWLDHKMATNNGPIYGINTGFGSLCNHSITNDQLADLQANLVMSHACGTGDPIRIEIVKLMLFLKIQSLSYGNSGVQLVTVQRLIDFYNHDVFPVVYELGSLGASGDLAPLAHLSLPLIGLGEIWKDGKIIPASNALLENGWEPIRLQSKEGLALLNGTQFMSANGVYAILKALRLSKQADLIAAISIEGFDARIEPFNALLHTIRHHTGQIETAKNIRELLEGSEIISRPKVHVQDPYSFRCIPQVHGAIKDTLEHVVKIITNEINAVTDNPTLFPEEELILSGGNFHGEPLALIYDFLAIAMSELGNISERRTYQLIGGKRDLPSFLVAKPGLNSGFMIPQYAAAAIVSQNKQLATPTSVDSIESSQGQEDHVSMGANGATRLVKLMDNVERILAIELMNATQALEFRRPAKSSKTIESFLSKYRANVAFVNEDRVMFTDIKESILFLQNN